MKKYIVTLTNDERKELIGFISKGKHRSQKILNALILLACDEGEFQKGRSTNKVIAKVLNISMKKIDRVKKRFVEDGLDITLNGRKGSRIYKKKADGDFEAHLVALSCSDPPEGFSRWSLRLLADKVVELDYIDNIGQCLNRRIDNIEDVKTETAAWQKFRNNRNAKVNWQFTTEDARIKLSRLYPTFES